MVALRVCLVSPPYMSAVKYVVGVSSPPLGLAYLASMIRDEHEVKIIDSNVLNYSFDDVRREMKNFDPDVVGITSVTPSIYEAYKVADLAKSVREDCIVIMGGPHATFLPDEVLMECKSIDIVVLGEGEETFRELINVIDRGDPLEDVKGIAFRKNEKTFVTKPRPLIKDLDKIPFPSFDMLPMDKYELQGVRYMSVISSRGCPFRCYFCASSRIFGGYWRGRSPRNVVEEIKLIHDKFGVKNIEFVDDTFTLNERRVEEICDEILRERLDISWGASSRVDSVNRELAEKMRRAGCWVVYLGIESASQEILDATGKRITMNQIAKAVRILKEAGIKVLGSFILGFPEETIETAEQTITLAKKLDLDYAQFSILTPYPGTPLYEYAKQNNMLLTRDWSKFTAIEPVMKLKNITPTQLKSLLEKAYLTFYVRPKMLWRLFRQKQFYIIKRTIKAVTKYLRTRVFSLQPSP
ncbi:MAG: B12-binding domain-containing radical SAM protein [Thaumarchaeota archaeon]|nr:B12-binding domain-containing radical SAM protein [Candidatus Terraquivivens yellowstonensis]